MKQRPIKFRQLIWDYDEDKFLKWHYWGIINGKFIEPQIVGINPENNYQSYQYTGLKDKNGKGIYEFDILKSAGIVTWNDVEVRWSCIDIEWNDRKEWHDMLWNTTPLEIIGNTIENKDLIK